MDWMLLHISAHFMCEHKKIAPHIAKCPLVSVEIGVQLSLAGIWRDNPNTEVF